MTEPDPLMSIGLFSRASLVSVKALRSYHELGLLVPAKVDPESGYRFYRVSQLIDAGVVRRLRALDVSLADIATIVAAKDPDVTRKIVAEHRSSMESRLAEVEHIVGELQEAERLPTLHTPVHVRQEEAVHALMFSGVVQHAEYAPFLETAFGALWAAVQATGAVPISSGSALYPPMVDTEDEPVGAYIPLQGPVMVPEETIDAGVTLTMVPAATCAVLTHAGSYQSISETYKQLGAWVAGNAALADQPVREHYIVSVDPATGLLYPDDQLRTEISWPITSNPITSEPSTSEPSTSDRGDT